ncbi:ABC transporter ATP-binding protein [Fluviicola sp.]|jgi:ABC-2 type transport system ATP-binding protein|uniref:ABC transporter ATP-binding protein n=1 Tax=Fluviicola sp. TaxID=1917219 RepID=UPI00281A47E8|nr:ABC transporter ATP-binding protein [Fluviicola sp.]MDR0801488.1 ABC transporter ATP-binding protein [Fluviicola sp.]
MQEPLLHVSKVYKSYHKSTSPSLDGVDFTIARGEITGIFGPNGAGKTTLISILCSILNPTLGSVIYYLGGEKSPREIRSKLGFVPQDFSFFPELTAKQNLEYFGSLYDIKRSDLAQKIDNLLQKMGLSHVKNSKVSAFSGGMKRRLNLIISLLHDPAVLFLDEPTVGVDVQSKIAIMNLLQELNQQGTTIIYTSHHLKEAEEFCNQIILIDHGKIIACNTLTSLLTIYEVANLENLILKLTGTILRD